MQVNRSNLKPQVPNAVKESIEGQTAHQKKYYDVGSRPLSDLDVGCSVRVQQANRLWKPAVVTEKHSDRSYIIQSSDGGTYRRNGRHLIHTNEQIHVQPNIDVNYDDNI